MFLPQKPQNPGFALIETLIVTLIVFSASFVFTGLSQEFTAAPTPFPTPTDTPTATPTPSPTGEPTSTPTPTPTPTPELTPTPAPTPTPVPVVSGLPAGQVGPPGSGHSRINIATERGTFFIDLVSIDMAGVRMISDTASDHDCHDACPTLPLSEYIARNGGFAGMNGSYFCPADYASCAGKSNSFDFPVYNSRLSKWINSGNLFWNDRSMVFYDGSMHFFRNANSYSGAPQAGVVNHPGLLEAGKIIADQFPLTDKQKAKGTKSGIGIRGNQVFLVIARNVDMLDLAAVFKSLGAEHALNLDGGGSVALWFGGYQVGPGRNLPNAVIFAR